MDEHVLRTAVRRDEAETFGCVEKFYGTSLGHGRAPSPVAMAGPRSPFLPTGEARFFLGGHAFAHESTPRQSGAVRYSQYRGKGRQNVPVSGSVNARTPRFIARKQQTGKISPPAIT